MDNKTPGLTIEGFVQGCFNRMFANYIEVRHHPITSWAQATVSGSQANFETTKAQVLCTFKGLQDALYKAGDNALLDELSEFESIAQQCKTIGELGDAIDEARPVLDRAYVRPTDG